MKTNRENAVEMFGCGYNCAQAVLTAFCEDYLLDTETALKMACDLGAGCRSGELCGAVSGGALVVGLKHGQRSAEDTDAKMNCFAATARFVEEFRTRNGSVVCRELLGYDLSTDEGRQKSDVTDWRSSPCVGYVRCAIELLEELGY